MDAERTRSNMGISQMSEYHKDEDGEFILDENGNKIPASICLCHALEPSECGCGAWDDVTDWEYD